MELWLALGSPALGSPALGSPAPGSPAFCDAVALAAYCVAEWTLKCEQPPTVHLQVQAQAKCKLRSQPGVFNRQGNPQGWP